MSKWNSIQNLALNYRVSLVVAQPNGWQVGYHPEHDEMFLYKIDYDFIITVMRKSGLDVMGFAEFAGLDDVVKLGFL